ncbi:hypothetical protein [Streptomyces sp. NPDC001500]
MSRVWLVAGNSRGPGRAIVEAALEGGDQVVATARRPEQLDDLLARCASGVGRVETVMVQGRPYGAGARG